MLFWALVQGVQAQTFESGTAVYDAGTGLLQIDATWSGFDVPAAGVGSLTFDLDASTNPFTFGVTAMESFGPVGGSFISTSAGMSTQALTVRLDSDITSAGNFSFTAVFSGVTSDAVGEPIDMG